jgi:hypothetical protein
MSIYNEIVIETFENPGEPAAERIRARPLAGQGLDTRMRVECSVKMREKYALGTKLKIRAKVCNRLGGTSFLYCHYSWPYEVLSDEEAAKFIKNHYFHK